MPSTESLPSFLNWTPKTIQQRVQRLMLNRSQVQVQGQLAATQSISRNLKREDDRAERYSEIMMGNLFNAPKKSEQQADEEMGDTYFGDRVTQVHNHAKTGMGTAAKLSAAAMVMAGIPGAAIAWNLPSIIEALKPEQSQQHPANSTDTDTDTSIEVGLGGGTVVD